ncbi:Cna B-type domain-containing protein [Blautia sp. MSK17_66]|uniref:Cna B-type domain-containing protein n=1 Tax=Blautia TaxID=572511 RepID=UPI001570A642|nr:MULTISPECIES: Cna B-type domain-containing protein [Blautia]MCB5551472.1 Cna B-type domain-containing protein [Blautia sp. MSK17_66]NSK02993.1 Cna B-type domain-containing protein [Blautia obeum]
MSKKPHSGLKRALAWMLTVAMMAQGCIVYADDFTSEPDAAVVEEAAVSEDVDTSADSDLESADEGEDTSTEADVPEISDEDLDTEVVADDQQDTDEGSEAPLFSDGSEEDAIVSDGAEAVGDDTADIGAYEPREGDVGTFTVAGNDVYEYHRYRTTDGKYSGKYRFAVANYPVNNATITMAPYETRQFVVQSLVATNYKTATDDVTTTQWWKDYSRNPSYWPHSTIKWALTEGSDHASIFGETNPVVTISAFEEGDVTLTGTWTGYNCNTSSKKYKACELVVTYKIHITPAVGKVNFGDKFVLSGSPTSQDIIDNSVLTESDSWGEDNAYTDFAATRDESGKIKAGMKECTMSYKAYPSKGQGTINHNYYVDFHEMIGKELNTTAISPDERAKLQETFRRDVSLPAPGIYVQTPDPVSIPKKGDYTFITTQVFNGGNGAVSSPAYTYKFMDDSASEYADDSSVITATTADKGKVKVTALKPGATSMKIIYSYTDKTTGEEKTAESKPIRITVNGIVFDEPATITLSADEAKDYKIKYKLFDYSKENPDVTTSIPEEDIVWSIDNKAIASISTDGVIRPKKEGSATVTLKATINGYQDTATQGVTVTSTGGRISLNKDSLTMTKGSSQSLTATAYYNNQKVSDAVFNWATDNDKVATVDGGKITAVGYGKTVITASWKAENGTTYAVKADVEVVQNGIYLTDAQNEVTMPQGSTQEIAWTLWNMGQYKAGSTGEGYNPSSDVTWKSADEAVATVDSVGVITAKDLPEGQTTASTTVTVSYKGTKVKDIKVNVTENQKVVVKGEAVEITGTKGETKTNKAGEDITDTWKIGYFENGHGSLNAQFYGNGIYNIDIVKQAGEKVSVTGKTPYSGYIYLSHKYYVPMETGQLYGVWQSIAIKVNGEAGLYLNKNSLSMKMGESGTATILGTFIKEDGTELERKFWADKSNPKLSKLEMVEGDTNIVTAQSDPADGRMLHLTAVSPGKTTITIKCYPFDPTATCEVEVTSDARLILQPAELTVKQGTTEKITAKAWDGSAYVENPQITWKSYNESIATVDGGVVTGVKRGNATVSAAWNGVNANDVKVTVTPSRNITLSTEWDDHDNQDGIRPEKATLQLTANDENCGDPIELNAENNWTYEWKLLDAEDAEGNNIVYRVKAENPKEYTAKVTGSADDGFVVTYSHEIAKVSATANVTWDDAENQDGIRPASVSLQLKSKVEGGEAVNVGDNVTVKADADGNWTKTWTDLPKYNAGKVIEYTVEESGLPEGYTITTTKDEETGAITLKNSYTPKGVDIAVSVNWNDADNQDGLRPEFVEAELYAGDASTGKKVKLTADNEWKATFEGLAVNKNGKPIEYSLVSTKAEGYEIKTTGSATEGLVLNYTHAVKTVDVKATVVWADGNNRDGVRPETVSLQLKADGENLGDVITVNEKSKWTKTWTGLGEYKAGKEVVYTVEVVGLKGGEDGYTAEITGDAGTGFTITATHVPAVAEIKASVNWDDADNQDAIRPEFVEAELYAGDVSTGKKVKLTADNKWTASFGEMDLKKDGKTIDYTLVATKVDGYDCVVEGSPAKGLILKYSHTTYKTDVTVTTKWDDAENQDGIRPNTYSVQLTADGEAVGDAITLNEAGNFTKTWKGLEKNKAGKAITYSVKASDVAKGYEAAVSSTESGIVVTLTHTPEVADIAVSAAWDDADNQDALRPASVEAEVLANGEATGNKVTLTAEGEWKATVKALPVYAAGQKITYTLKSDVDAYTSACTSTADGLVLKFTHKTETVDVTLTTKWNDKENQDGNRPSSYSVQLMADGVKVGDLITLNAGNEFSKTWTGLQKNRTGKVGEAIVYTAEATVPNPDLYETSVSGDAATGLVVTNTYVPATVEIPVSVKWDDAENQDGVRLDSVEAELYADGEATGNKVTLNAENSWTAKFAQVDVKKDGTRIKYEVKSTEKEGYTVSVSGNILDEEGLTLNYKHVPATVNISAKAAWNDAKNQDGIRPTDTLVQLYADGEVLGDKAVLESGKSWTKTWAELPKYKAGKEIAYKVVASAVSGYSVKVSGDVEKGYTVTYAHSVAKTKVTVKNTWNDLNNVVDSRPSKLVVEIYANGKATGKRVTLTSANKWTATVSNLNKKSAGKVISYTGKVVGAPSGYSISIKSANGTVNVTSKYTKITKKLNLKLSKTSYVYTGKNLKPTVTVYNGKKKVANKYYTVTYKNNKNTGYATVIVKGKGKFAKYAGKATFTIKPKQMRKPSVKSTAKKTLAVGWVRDAQATKYVVQYSQNNKFQGKTTKSVTINKNTIGKTTLKGLASGRYYYVRVRSYKVANGKNIYAPSWSQVVKVRVK